MTVDDFLDICRQRGREVKRNGSSWAVSCPGPNHSRGDHNPSLSVSAGRTQPVVLACQSGGCTTAQICAALGIVEGDLCEQTLKPRGKEILDPVAEYTYTDAAGNPVAKVERKQGRETGRKYFFQLRPNPKGSGWLNGLDGFRPPLYNLPAVLKAKAAGKTILFVEGEKDVDRLARDGITAATRAAGALKRADQWEEQFSEALTGACVVIVGDNDAEGQLHARVVKDALTGVARKVRILTLPGIDEINKKGADISDWLAAGHTRDELKAAVTAALQSDGKEASISITGATAAAEATKRRPRWLWQGLIPRSMITILAGPGEQGKGALSMLLAAQLSKGELPGELRGRPAATYFASTEDTIAETLNPRCCVAGADPGLILLNERPLSIPNDLEALETDIRNFNVALLVLDPVIGHINSDNFNSHKDQDVRLILDRLAGLASRTGVAILGIHHLNKSTDTVNFMTRLTGSISWGNAPRSIIGMVKAPEASPENNLSVVTHVKCNIGKRQQSRLYRIDEATYETDDGETATAPLAVFVGGSDLTANDLLVETRPEERAARDEILDYLEMEAPYPKEIDAKRALKEITEVLGVSPQYVRQVAKSAGWKPHRVGGTGSGGSWIWRRELESIS